MTSIVRRPLYRFRMAGTSYALAADPVQNEALEGVVTRAVDVELQEEPTLATNQTAKISLIERVASTITEQFSGWVNRVSGESYPNRVVLTCTGPLARLRRVPTHDHNLTGMTDGEAVMHVLDACNIDYTASDIQDAGYELGAIEPVYWLTDQPGHEIIAELDRVFGMATIETGAGRVVRFAYDRAPSSAHISQTYQRGVNAEFWRNQRDRGDLDRIQNVWQVTGLSWSKPESEGGDGCSRTVWARGEGDNAALGAGVRNRAGTFQSDIIQDSALAKAVATRMMRWYNRQPDELTIVALNDPARVPGSVVGVKDAAYGVDLTASAASTPYLVLTVDRRGDEMTLGCVGGAAGATGTITGGVEKVCNQATTGTLDTPPLFTPPPISVPPVPPTDPFSEGGGSEDPFCLSTTGPHSVSWFNEPGNAWSISGSTIESAAGTNYVADTNEMIPRISGLPASYTVNFDATITGAGGFELYMTDNDDSFPVHFYMTYMSAGSPGADIQFYDFNAWTGGGNSPLEWGDATPGATVPIEIAWNRISESFTVSIDGVTHILNGAEDGCSAGVFLVAISHSFGTLGDPATSKLQNVTISIDEDVSDASCGPDLLGVCGVGDGTNLSGSSLWSFVDGTWTVDPDTGYMTATGASAAARFTGIPISTSSDWEVEMVFQGVFSDAANQDESNFVELSVGSLSSITKRQALSANFDQVAPAEETTFVGNNDSASWSPPGVGTDNYYGGATVYPLNSDVTFNLSYDAGTGTLSGSSSVAGSNSVSTSTWTDSAEPVYVMVRVPFVRAISQDLIVVKSVKVLSGSEDVVCV